jgi:O-antigen ligase
MISSVVVCASRGGIVALVSGWMVCLAIYFRVFVRLRQLGAVLLTLSIVLALVSWFGFARVEARLATLWPDEIRKEGRLSLWHRMLPLVKDFPVWGTGYGTFQYVEPLCRSDPTDEEIYTNAENEYLEGLVEGGFVRLLLSLFAIGLGLSARLSGGPSLRRTAEWRPGDGVHLRFHDAGGTKLC